LHQQKGPKNKHCTNSLPHGSLSTGFGSWLYHIE